MNGLVLDIQKFCIHDGPGIRTSVFLKGCPLQCYWCHNPESQQPHPQLLFTPDLCIDCKSCEEACPEGAARENLSIPISAREACVLCLRCAEACPTGAIEAAGREMSVAEVMAEVEKDRAFYSESGGGMTLTGGEPMAQFEFAREILKEAKSAGIHTCLETCGFAPPERFDEIRPYVDLFLWDVKDTDRERHKKNTGADPALSWANLRRIDAAGAKSLLRCILIAEENLDTPHIESLARLHNELKNVQGIELLPFHNLGESKRSRLGVPNPERAPSRPAAEEVSAVKAYFESNGIKCLCD
jgi:pyruvate formate lyase activating enzyme